MRVQKLANIKHANLDPLRVQKCFSLAHGSLRLAASLVSLRLLGGSFILASDGMRFFCNRDHLGSLAYGSLRLTFALVGVRPASLAAGWSSAGQTRL